MLPGLSIGLSVAKGLAVAWQVPLLGVHHMQAHALTPRLVSALGHDWAKARDPAVAQDPLAPKKSPPLPFLSLLVSGGHTQLLLSRSITLHSILAESPNIAIGDMLDKCARAILPADVLNGAPDVMYGALLERFAFPNGKRSFTLPPPDELEFCYQPPARRADEIRPYVSPKHGWSLTPPLADRRDMAYDFTGLGGQVQALMQANPDMDDFQRRELAYAAMKLTFEHLASRVLFALDGLRRESEAAAAASASALGYQQDQDQDQDQDPSTTPSPSDDDQPFSSTSQTLPPPREVQTLVVAGGVASNAFLMHVLEEMLRVRGHAHVAVVRPPARYCTDNAAMVGWAGLEMWENGWKSSYDILPVRKWPMDAGAGKKKNKNAAAEGGEAGGDGNNGGTEERGGILELGGWESRGWRRKKEVMGVYSKTVAGEPARDETRAGARNR
ncbi:hypothetical protein VTI74DRAFT_2289 [Chaetomium olivicolor]